MSDPYDRDMLTIILRPSLASQAPSVKRIILIVGIGIMFMYSIIGINNTRLSIIPSKQSKDINM